MTGDCVRGCVQRGEHYAACEDFGRDDGACEGCVARAARDGAVICSRCYGRLWSAFQTGPELVEHLRERTRMASAHRLSHTRSPGAPAEKAPTSPDLLDALRDLGVILRGEGFPASADEAETRAHAGLAVGAVLARFDDLAGDGQSVAEWWPLMLALEIPDAPHFWTFARAAARWPIRDRRRWAANPCPECDFKTVIVSPPRDGQGRTWYECQQCEWTAHDTDDDGFWGDAFERTSGPVQRDDTE